MENTRFPNTRRLVFGVALITVIASMTVTSVRADGNLLAGFDVPATTPEGHSVRPSIYWPIGVTFNGANLYYSQPCECTSGIFQTTTGGVLINTLHEVSQVGALAWDGSHLWAGSFPFTGMTCTTGSTGCAFITEIDPVSGNPIQTIDLSAVFAQDQECSFIDGLSYDSSNGSFWVSPDIGCLCGIVPNCDAIGFAYDVNMAGNLIQKVQEPFGVAGVAKVGNNLYMVAEGFAPRGRTIVETTLTGTVVSSFPTISVSGNHEHAESIAFDPTTFAPNCALWAVQDYGFPFDASLAAYQIACP